MCVSRHPECSEGSTLDEENIGRGIFFTRHLNLMPQKENEKQKYRCLFNRRLVKYCIESYAYLELLAGGTPARAEKTKTFFCRFYECQLLLL